MFFTRKGIIRVIIIGVPRKLICLSVPYGRMINRHPGAIIIIGCAKALNEFKMITIQFIKLEK